VGLHGFVCSPEGDADCALGATHLGLWTDLSVELGGELNTSPHDKQVDLHISLSDERHARDDLWGNARGQ